MVKDKKEKQRKLTPLIVLGVVPMITGILIGSGSWLAMGIIMTISTLECSMI